MFAKNIDVRFNPRWILANQISGRSAVIDDVITFIKESFSAKTVTITEKAFHRCRLRVVFEEYTDSDEIYAFLKEKFGYADGCGFECESEDACDGTVSESAESKSGFDCNLNELIGLEPLKKWIVETEKISSKFAGVVMETNVIKNVVYLLSINRGNGLSTALHLMAKSLKKSSFVIFEGKSEVIEWRLAYTEKTDEFPSFEGLLNRIDKTAVPGKSFKGIVSINVEEWLDKLSDKRFDTLLDFVWSNRDDMVFVFTVPYAEKSVTDRLHNRIDDIISVRTMKFAPPSDEQYFVYFGNIFAKYGIRVDEAAYADFIRKITAEKNDGRFYGFNTVRKVVNEVLYGVIREAAVNDTDIPGVIGHDDFARLYGSGDVSGISGIEQLSGMIALNEVKNKVREIISTVKLQKELYAKGKSDIRPCFHMMFSGNPGTGKTVVARIIGRIFKEEGLLQVGNFFEVSRKDFIGKFVGHTAPKTMEICRSAYGSVLFIDEAYMLADAEDGFSAEAIGTLIAEMENNRDKMVVIFAGYEKELEKLFDMNPGLKDRIPYKISFPNYSRDELKEIFYSRLGGKLEFDESFAGRADCFFASISDDVMQMRDFSNGRFVRNLVERIISKSALRFEMAGADIAGFKLTGSDFDVAVSDNDFKKLFNKVKKANSIGF